MDVVFHNALENAEKSSNYLKKIKKQAKRLLKYSKENTRFTINNLAQAQELLAQINGYPSWHALEKTITSTSNKNEIINEEMKENNQISSLFINDDKITLTEKKENYFIYRTPSEVKSFFNINVLSEDSVEFMTYLKNIIDQLSFHFKMGFHNIEVKLMKGFYQNNIAPNKAQYDLIALSSSWNIDPKLANKLFSIDSVVKPINDNTEYALNIIIAVSTINDMENEHDLFCAEVEKVLLKENISRKISFTQKEQDFILDEKIEDSMQEYNINENVPNIWYKFFEYEKEMSYLFIHVIDLLLTRTYKWNVSVNCLNKKIQLWYSKEILENNEIKNKKYLDGMMKSIRNTDSEEFIQYPMIKYKNKILSEKIDFSYNDGLAMHSLINGKVNYYKHTPYGKGVEAIYGIPGSGKGLFLNAKKCDIILRGNQNALPFIGMIDIGHTSTGLISFLKDSLPSNQKQLVQSYTLKMTEDYCMNPFDTPLGCRFPSKYHQESLIDFIQVLIEKDAYNEMPQPAIRNFIGKLIYVAYNNFSDNENPKKYDKGVNLQIDKLLNHYNIKTNHKTTWWEVVDALFLKNEINMAELAQYNAMPLLSELIHLIGKIRDEFAYEKVGSSEYLPNYFSKMIIHQVNKYIVLSKPTTLNNDARIISLNLEEVANVGNAEANHQATVMYMLSMIYLNKNTRSKQMNSIYPLPMVEPPEVPTKEYITYYNNLLNDRNESYLFYDEMHRVNMSYYFDRFFTNQWNENGGRSYITVVSQTLDIFRNIKDLISNIIVLGIEKNNIDKVSNCFNLSNEEVDLLKKGYIGALRKENESVKNILFAKLMDKDKWKYNLLSFKVNFSFIDFLEK